MNAARTGYDALEALTDGTITAEERAWLEARAQESPEWAAALKAHAPLTAVTADRYVEAILKVLDEDKVVPLRPRTWVRPAAIALSMAAGVAIFALIPPGSPGPTMPSYAVSHEGSGMCEAKVVVRAGEPGGDCGLFVLRPATTVAATELAVKIYDEKGTELKAARVDQKENGLLHVYLSAEDAAKTISFVIGTPTEMPKSFEEARSSGRLIQ